MANKVWYIGSADVRVIKAADWAAVNAAGQSTDVTWDSTNAWGVDPATLDAAAVTYLGTQNDFATAAADPLAAYRPNGAGSQAAVQYATEAEITAIEARLDALENPA